MKRLVNEGLRTILKVPNVWWKSPSRSLGCTGKVITDHPVMLNRQPYRLGIQAFEPVLVEGRAIKIHHWSVQLIMLTLTVTKWLSVPLSAEAQAEAPADLSAQNILNPKDGRPVVTPTQDMVMGIY